MAKKVASGNNSECGWVYRINGDYYETGCGEEVDLSGIGTVLDDVKWEYCPHCGAPIVEESCE